MKITQLMFGLLFAGSAVLVMASGADPVKQAPKATTASCGTAQKKPPGRFAKSYRIMWADDDGATLSWLNPPLTPGRFLQGTFGSLEGSPVDAYVCTVGEAAGYTTSYPSKVSEMDFLLDRLNRGEIISDKSDWGGAANLRSLWDAGYDPIKLRLLEAHRLGMDFWLQLRMNDWHHFNESGEDFRLISGRFYSAHPEYRIGADGARGWPESLAKNLKLFQDFSHAEVRQHRLAVAEEACQRYEVDGWEYDFMRCPGFFKYGEERQNAHLITDLIRRTRAMLDQIGEKRGRYLGLSVRVPNTIAGSLKLGLEVPTWIAEGIVDIVVPSAFFAADTGEDATEWVKLAAGSLVRINPAIEEAFSSDNTEGMGVPYFQVKRPVMKPLTVEMIRAIAARHLANGADGLYVFNWPNTGVSYGYDHRPAIDDIANYERLRHKDKRYLVMRRNKSFPNCLPTSQVIPAALSPTVLQVPIDIVDDPEREMDRMRQARLHILYENMSIEDEIKVALNGTILHSLNPLTPGGIAGGAQTWQEYDVLGKGLKKGRNQIEISLTKRNPRLEKVNQLFANDVELSVDYLYPNGKMGNVLMW